MDHRFLPETDFALEEIESGRKVVRVSEELLPKYASLVRGVLQARTEELGTQYSAVRMPESKELRASRMQVVQRLSELLPELVFLELHHECLGNETEHAIVNRIRLRSEQ